MASQVFKRVAGLKPGRSVFDLSHDVKLTCDMGQLIPVLIEEMVPGDHFKVGNQIVCRFAPLIAPIMHEVNVYVHYFFVPYRLLWDEWEDFITGGEDGTLAPTLPVYDTTDTPDVAVGSLYDYLGFPTGFYLPAAQRPVAFPQYAYNLIYNEYYRDQTLINEVELTSKTLKIRAWEKDYFTSALPWQQRGTPVSLPISGLTSAEWEISDIGGINPSDSRNLFVSADNATTPKLGISGAASTNANTNANNFLNDNEVDLSSATTFDVADLRLAFQIQKFLERNARAGARYTEFLGAHFGVHPRDDRLQRPEYIGGTKSPVIISEVLQTSSTDTETPQGNMAGHGITADRTYAGSYSAQEFGVMMGIMSVMPKPAYRQGTDRQWLRRTRYDFYFPEFANLSEQAITRQEIYSTTNEANNNIIFGYQGRYDELRYRPNRVAGLMRTDFNFWHLCREFSSAPALNQTFIECVPSKRVFAAPTEPACIVQVGNLIKAIRPMPIVANPGLIDHN